MVVYRCAPHLKRIFVASESKSGWGVGVAAFAWVDDEGVVEGKKAERWGKGEKERKTGGGGGRGVILCLHPIHFWVLCHDRAQI